MKKISRRTALKRAGGTVALASVAGFGFSRWDTESLALDTLTITATNWTGKPLTLGYFSDAHLSDEGAAKRVQTACEYLVGQRPDAIVFGGDFVEANAPDSYRNVVPAFAKLRAYSGPKLAVLGNHDYAIPQPMRALQEVHKAGFRVLKNETVQVGNATLLGLDCMSFHRGRPEMISTLSDVANLVVLVHEPDTVTQMDSGTATVVIAGHSHGGQICLPGGVALHTPPLARKYVSGFYADAPIPLFVSRGLGVTELPFRLFCRPQATLITIRGSES